MENLERETLILDENGYVIDISCNHLESYGDYDNSVYRCSDCDIILGSMLSDYTEG